MEMRNSSSTSTDSSTSSTSSRESRYTTRSDGQPSSSRESGLHTSAPRDRASRASDGPEPLSRALGWFSLGLGLAQVAVPADVARLAGADPNPDTIRLMRALGMRELSSGLGILSGKRTEDWVRARVAGDVMDLALLARLLAKDSSDRGRTVAAGLMVAGVTALDVWASKRARQTHDQTSDSMSNASGEPASTQPGTKTIRRAITINRSPSEVEAFWREQGSDTDAIDEHVRFVPAPGGRGTEVHLLRTYEKPGPLASLIAKARHHDPAQIAFDELLALKQVIETGDIVVSDAWLNGPSMPHAAQPE